VQDTMSYVAQESEDSLDLMKMTICHLAPLINYMFMSNMTLS